MKAKEHKLTFRVSKQTKNKLKRIARREKRTMTSQLEKMIADIPEGEEKEKTA
jgi:predicted transcriptional regulator